MSEANPTPIYVRVPPKPRSRLRRFGCGIAVVLWIVLLISPCALLALASQGEIAIQLGDIPGQSLRIWMVSEARERGVGIARPSVYTNGDSVCLQTNVSFLLWQGQGQATTYCDCYTRSGSELSLVSSSAGVCSG